MTRVRIGGSPACPRRCARAATGAVAHTDPPSSAAPAAPVRRRNVARVNRSPDATTAPPGSASTGAADRLEPLAQRRLGLAGLVEARADEPVGHELLLAHLARVGVRVVVADAAPERRRPRIGP